jgi:hypothetical protein
MFFKVETQIEKWLRQRPIGTQEKRDQQPAKPAISIQERMNRFELDVYKSSFDDWGSAAVSIMDEAL